MSGRYALIVEDHNEIAQLFALILEGLGFTADTATDGQAALDHMAETPPDLVVLDLNIPKVSGVEVLRHIRAHEPLAGTKVIIVSANPHMIEETYDLADLVLQKPISYAQFRALVQRLT
jgi:CheY-like chemotaxis protein